MSLALVRHEIAAVLDAKVDAKVIEYGGTFDRAALKRVSVQAPALVVTCTGVPRFAVQGPVVTAEATWACISVATGRTREAVALALFEEVAAAVPYQRWNGSATHAARDIVGANLHSAELEAMGVNMWALRWRQSVDLDRQALANLGDFEKFYGDYKLAGGVEDTPVTQDHVEMPQ